MPKRKSWRYGKWLMLVVLLIVVGCQSIGGLDLNKAMSNGINAKSVMQNATLSLQLQMDPDYEADERMKEIVELLNDAKLEMNDIRMESQERISMKGKLSLALGEVPFHLFIDTEKIALHAEGLSKTIVVPLTNTELEELGILGEMVQKMNDALVKDAKYNGIDKSISSFFVNNFPNPKNVKVSLGSEKINGFHVDGYKLEASLDGSEVLPMLKTFLRNMAEDEKELKVLVGQLYDLFWPNIEPYLLDGSVDDVLEGGLPIPPAMSGLKESLTEALGERELAIDMIHTTLKQLLYVGMVGVDTLDKSEHNPLKEILNKNTTAKAYMHFDRAMDLRKSDIELSIASPNTDSTGGISSVLVKMESEYWDYNMTIKADELAVGASPLILDEGLTPDAFDQLVTEGSVLEELIDTVKSLTPPMPDYSFAPQKVGFQVVDPESITPLTAYIENGTGYAPLWLLASQLGAYVEYEDDLILITDDWGTEIVLKQGSKEALVDGEPFELENPVMQHGEFVYVPVRFVAEMLGASVTYIEEEQIIEIELY